MKKILIAICLVFIPAMSFGAELACGKSYSVTFSSDLLSSDISGTMALVCNDFSQGIIGIEYANGEIGTGAFTTSSLFALSGTCDLYDDDGNYYNMTFEGFSLGFFISCSGTITQFASGESGEASFRGMKAR